jgi:hypothetical protein
LRVSQRHERSKLTLLEKVCVWAPINPGSTVACLRSTTCAPGGMVMLPLARHL